MRLLDFLSVAILAVFPIVFSFLYSGYSPLLDLIHPVGASIALLLIYCIIYNILSNRFNNETRNKANSRDKSSDAKVVISEIREHQKHYMEFHTKIIGWFLTFSGFFLAALLTVNSQKMADLSAHKYLFIAAISMLNTAFIYTILSYSGRVEKLKINSINKIVSDDWYDCLEETIHGECLPYGFGSKLYIFFIIIVSTLNLTLFEQRIEADSSKNNPTGEPIIIMETKNECVQIYYMRNESIDPKRYQ